MQTEGQPLPDLAAMGFVPGRRVHCIQPDVEVDATKLIDLMDQQVRIVRLATAAGTIDRGDLVTVEVQISSMIAVLRSGTEFEVDGVYVVTETEWREIVGFRIKGEIVGYHGGITTKVVALDAPRSFIGYCNVLPDEVAETPDDEHVPFAAKVWLQLVPPAATNDGEDYQVTPLFPELQ